MTQSVKLHYILRTVKSGKWFEAGWVTQQDPCSKQNRTKQNKKKNETLKKQEIKGWQGGSAMFYSYEDGSLEPSIGVTSWVSFTWLQTHL